MITSFDLDSWEADDTQPVRVVALCAEVKRLRAENEELRRQVPKAVRLGMTIEAAAAVVPADVLAAWYERYGFHTRPPGWSSAQWAAWYESEVVNPPVPDVVR